MTKTKKIVGAVAILVLTIVIVLLALSLDFFPKDKFESSLRKSIRNNMGGIISIRDVTPFNWDRMDILPPYSRFRDASNNEIYIDEGHCLLVFYEKGNPIYHLTFSRRFGDFAELYREGGYSPLEARFMVPNEKHRYWLKLRHYDVDLSTPERTVTSYYDGFKRSDFKYQKRTVVRWYEDIAEKRFNVVNPILRNYEIIKIRKAEDRKDDTFHLPESDIQIIVREIDMDNRESINSIILREFDGKWLILGFDTVEEAEIPPDIKVIDEQAKRMLKQKEKQR